MPASYRMMVTANTLVQGSDTWVSGSSSVVTTMPVSSTAHIIAFVMDFWLTGRIETGAVPGFLDTSHSVRNSSMDGSFRSAAERGGERRGCREAMVSAG